MPTTALRGALEVIGMTDNDVFVVSRRKKNGFFCFPNSLVEERLGVPATSRSWSTVIRLAEVGGRRAEG